MGETQTILKKFETNARKRLKETKELLKGFLNKEKIPEPEPKIEKPQKSTDEGEWDYSEN